MKKSLKCKLTESTKIVNSDVNTEMSSGFKYTFAAKNNISKGDGNKNEYSHFIMHAKTSIY